jgi:phage shock protein A
MSETLRTRVSRVIAGSVHALLDRIEDQAPDVYMEQAIREADGVINDVRHELGLITANRHLAQKQHAKLNSQHAELSGQINEALTHSREDLAHAAIARQLDIEAQLPVLEGSLSDLAAQEHELQSFVGALLAKKREMEDALAAFRQSRAAAQSNAAAVAPGATVADQRMQAATSAFDRLHARQTGLSAQTSSNNLAQAGKLRELEDLVRANKIAERLAQLKAGQS